MYEWLPYNSGVLDEVPAEEGDRKIWMANRRLKALAETAEGFRGKLVELYGKERGERVNYAEAFEVCESGSSLTDERMATLFPFLGAA